VLYAKGKYKDGNFSPDQSYLYLTIIYTISYTVALYALVLFYVACKDLLQPFNPVPKFVIIKSVVFLTYWQVIFRTLLLSLNLVFGINFCYSPYIYNVFLLSGEPFCVTGCSSFPFC